MGNLNRWVGIGRVTKDLELRYTQSGGAVTSFSIAINEKWKDKQGEQKESVDFINLVAWEQKAELCSQYLKKGSQVYVEGKLKTRSWENEQGKQWTTEVIINNIQFLDSKPQESSQSQYQAPAQPNREYIADDIPF